MQTILQELDKLIPTHPKRKRVYEKFYFVLNENIKNYEDDDIKKIALNIERGVFNCALKLYSYKTINDTWNDVFNNIYINKAVIIYDNLNPNGKIRNKQLLTRLLSKEFNEFQLCSLPPDKLFPERWEQNAKNCLIDNLDMNLPVKLTDQPDGLFKCGRCKSYKTEYTEKQTRSADEPTTKFCYCHNCGNRWKFC